MDERNEGKIRRISGRLTDTLQEEETPRTRAVFTPRRLSETEAADKVRMNDRTQRTDRIQKTDRTQTEKKQIDIPIKGGEKIIRPEERIRMMQPVRHKEEQGQQISGSTKRRRHQEMEAQLRALWIVLGILSALLAAAIVYEIILGHGVQQTGAQRMAEQENIIIIQNETELKTETERSIESVLD